MIIDLCLYMKLLIDLNQISRKFNTLNGIETKLNTSHPKTSPTVKNYNHSLKIMIIDLFADSLFPSLLNILT